MTIQSLAVEALRHYLANPTVPKTASWVVEGMDENDPDVLVNDTMLLKWYVEELIENLDVTTQLQLFEEAVRDYSSPFGPSLGKHDFIDFGCLNGADWSRFMLYTLSAVVMRQIYVLQPNLDQDIPPSQSSPRRTP